MKRIKLPVMLVVLLMLLVSVCPLAAAEETVEDWYYAGTDIDGTYVTAEALGAFMHLQMRADGVAANIAQNGTELVGTWRQENDQIIFTFNGSDGVFTVDGDRLVADFGKGEPLYFTHEVAGTYVPGNTLPIYKVEAFNGKWNVKWIWTKGSYQSIEFLRRNFGMEDITVVLVNGVLQAEDANYGMTFSDNLLYFGTNGELSLVIGLLDDGMLCYADKANDIVYYCERAN